MAWRSRVAVHLFPVERHDEHGPDDEHDDDDCDERDERYLENDSHGSCFGLWVYPRWHVTQSFDVLEDRRSGVPQHGESSTVSNRVGWFMMCGSLVVGWAAVRRVERCCGWHPVFCCGAVFPEVSVVAECGAAFALATGFMPDRFHGCIL